jgi:hypothetical protein
VELSSLEMRIIINGQEITNPLFKAIIGSVAIAAFALIILLFLPLIGIAFAISLGVFLGVFGVALIALFIIMFVFQQRKSNHVRLKKKDQ